MYTDHFDGIYGRKLALRRAIKSFSKEDRKAIWKVYLSSTRQILRNKPKENSIFS
jgi:hypothetical protein